MELEQLDVVLASLVGREVPYELTVVFAENAGCRALPDLTGRELDNLLRELLHRGWLTAERQEGDGSVVWWSQLIPTLAGLRHLGHWPPSGQEYLPGPWDCGLWGTFDRGVLEGLAQTLQTGLPAAGFVERPSMGEQEGWQRWEACHRLADAGLIDGEWGEGYLANVRLTSKGNIALNPPADDPLARARLKLRQGAKSDAVTAAIDEALKPALRKLAIEVGLPESDIPPKLAKLNDQLKAAGAYGDASIASEARRAQAEAWLKLRNAIDHGEGGLINDRWIELMLDGIELFLAETGVDEQPPRDPV